MLEEYDVQQRLNQQAPKVDDVLQQRLNNLKGISDPISKTNFTSDFHIPAQTSSFNPFRQAKPTGWIGNDLFGSQAATAIRSERVKTDTQAATEDALYELPDNSPDLELGDVLIKTLGANAEDLFNTDNLTKKEEEDEILKKKKMNMSLRALKILWMKREIFLRVFIFLWWRKGKLL